MKTTAPKALPPMSDNDRRRFEKRIDKTGFGPRGTCWKWKGSTPQGYGSFYYAGNTFSSHRVAYFAHTGDDPGDLDILHKCNFPMCVRWSHLRKGTHAENMNDRDKAGHQSTKRGADHPVAKLTEEQVLDIRAAFARGIWTKMDLARQYNVSHRLIRNIVNRTAWKHI